MPKYIWLRKDYVYKNLIILKALIARIPYQQTKVYWKLQIFKEKP
jgi:hypothetical protein